MVVTATTFVVAVKLAVVAPAATTTLDGTCTAALLLDSVTVAPPKGATPVSVTIPVALFPPMTDDGLRATDASVEGLTVKLAVRVTP